MKPQTRHFFLIAAGVVLLMLATSASAQSPAGQETQPQQVNAVSNAPPDQVPPIAPEQPRELRRPYWASIGGFEVDTHDSGYGFFGPMYVRPLRPNVAFVAGANASYMYYEYPSGSGHTNVRAPGVAARGGVKLGEKNYVALLAGPGFRRRHADVLDASGNKIESFSDTLVGLNLGGELWVDPTSHNNIFGLVDYNTRDHWTWSRLAFKEQISNRNWSRKFTHYVGAEVIGQGNQDIRSAQVGAFIELVHVPSTVSVMLRGGYKRSMYDIGPDRTGPWIAIGFYQRLP